ncbi:MAG TPA: 50S ribosomal protein L10 [Isosphaeraceae bacterium]|jgi:large subunit ribosomal protein L10|nr:50S ribosomal protein L10 [Isosphaeraceae bacterium]
MSKYVKEMMMEQLRSDLDGSNSVLILDFKGLDAVSENRLRLDLRKKKIRMRTLKNTLARRVFAEMGMEGLSRYLEGPSVLVWGADGPAELAKEISDQVKKLKKPAIKGGAVDGVVITPAQVEDITKLPSREVLIGQLLGLALSPAQQLLALAGSPASTLVGQLEALAERLGGGGEQAPPTEEAAPAEGAAPTEEAAPAEPTA